MMVTLSLSVGVMIADRVRGTHWHDQAVGSVLIDEAFKGEVNRRLRLVTRDHGFPSIPENAASELVRTKFEAEKTSFGTSTSTLPEFKFRVPGLSDDFSNKEARIERGRIIFKKCVFQSFDSNFFTSMMLRAQLKIAKRFSTCLMSRSKKYSDYLTDNFSPHQTL